MQDYERTDLLAAGALRTGTVAVLGQLEATRRLMFSGMPADGLSADALLTGDAVDAAIMRARAWAAKCDADYETLRGGDGPARDEAPAERR